MDKILNGIDPKRVFFRKDGSKIYVLEQILIHKKLRFVVQNIMETDDEVFIDEDELLIVDDIFYSAPTLSR